MALKKLITYWRYKKNLLSNIRKEIQFFFCICHQISYNINITNNHKILTKSVYFEYLEKIKCVDHHLKKLLSPLSMRGFKKTYSIIYALKLSKIRLELINIVQIIGSCSIYNLLRLFVNIKGSELEFDKESLDVIETLDRQFIPINCELFKAEQIHEKHGIEDTNIQSPLIVKNNLFTKSFSMRIYGCKVFIPYNKNTPQQLFVLTGFFRKEIIPQFNKYQYIADKYQTLETSLHNSKIEPHFRDGFLDSIQTKDLLIYNNKELLESALHKYNEFKRIHTKIFSDILKEFINSEIENQYEIILILLLNNQKKENIYIANVLFDMLEKDASNTFQIIYDSLPWKQQQLLYISKQSDNQLSKDLLRFTEESIPLEKRILLMKAPEYVKSKAMEKLKEVSNNKGGENTIKAQQYIEGLLKIPFYQYQEEVELYYLKQFKSNLKEILKTIPSYEKRVGSITKNFLTIEHFFNDLKMELLQSFVSLESYKNLKKLCNISKINTTGKKADLINRILNNKSKIIIQHLVNISDNIVVNSMKDIQVKYLIDKNTEWISYKENRKQYLLTVSKNLNKSVYGMDHAKSEIKRIIAQWINGDKQGYIMGFEGPPGTGKTTLGKKGISECLVDKSGKKRPFVFIALGGSTNGSTLEGHNYTYVGSTWGKITDSLIEAKCMNPIIYIDELDKISKTEHGKEIIGILIHLTDPSQNEEFVDKYFSGIKIDISKCLIIFSYNDPTLIDKVLLDRIHRIKIDPLTRYEKFQVCLQHLIPEITKTIGYKDSDIILEEEVLYTIIDNYTLEAGARKLKECLFDIYREINLRSILDETITFPFTITKQFVEEVFEKKPKIQTKIIQDTPLVGLVNGLYATASGIGGITTIEAKIIPSDTHLSLQLTGQQGDVMKESMKVAKTLATNLLEFNQQWLDPYTLYGDKLKYGIHIHCPEAAQPKDGPSAGLAITIAIYSLLSGIPIKNTVAITGEVDLFGNALEIGGLDSKLEGARKAGVKLVLFPVKNSQDIEIIKKSKYNPIHGDFQVKAIHTIQEALDEMLVK